MNLDSLRSASAEHASRVAILWRSQGEAHERATVPVSPGRLNGVFEALARRSIHAEPVIYSEESAATVREQLATCAGVLVWVDPISDGRDRKLLDAMLCEAAAQGIWVSAHPDIIQKMGVKEVLYRTRELGWGTDVALYRTPEELRRIFPTRLRSAGPRVIKRNRGNAGSGVWKVVEMPSGDAVTIVPARRGSAPEVLPLKDFLTRCEGYIREDGCLIDQRFQDRLAEGMIRCYLGSDRVVGFGFQQVEGLSVASAPGSAAQQSPRIMFPSAAAQFQRLRILMETEWIPRMMELLEIRTPDLPLIWDADFLHGPCSEAGEDTYALCEINVSSVFPIPEGAYEAIAGAVESRLGSRGR